ncbi:MAG: hypothetical protein K5657_07945 [Desulfovibrio sp.]|nr:hypothetical protein [Desulfovibrio sp.]
MHVPVKARCGIERNVQTHSRSTSTIRSRMAGPFWMPAVSLSLPGHPLGEGTGTFALS